MTRLAGGLAPPQKPSHRRDGWSALLFLLPAVTIIGTFHLWASGFNVAMGFTDWSFAGVNFIGGENFTRLASGGEFWNSLAVTLFFIAGTVPITVAVAIPIAYLLYQVIPRNYLYRLLLFLPYIVPTVATSLVWSLVFSPSPGGIANAVRSVFGMAPKPWLLDSTGAVEWLASFVGVSVPGWAEGPSIALVLVMVVRFWQMLGFTILILYSGMTQLDPETLEAARVDGATERQILRRVVVPLLSPTLLFVTVVSFIFAIREFNTIFVLTAGGPASTTETLTMLIFRQFFVESQLGRGAATATVLFAIILLITWAQFRLGRRWVFYRGGGSNA
jgi:ABC-type sugar transport system permease subunit